MISVIIPAHDEARFIGACLQALFASDALAVPVEVIVVANGCTDATAGIARSFAATARDAGWSLTVLDLPGLGKPGALNAGDRAARYPARVYLDADVVVDPGLMAGLWAHLDRAAPAFASGRVRITGKGAVARAYARLWARLPFMVRGVPGCGVYAVNAPGRARWGDFPPVISDDTYVRLHFAPAERHLAEAGYDWPVAEGFAALVRVRRRQDAGVVEIARAYPSLLANDDKRPLGHGAALRLALSDPIGFLAYGGVALAVRIVPAPKAWSRGR
ncbi:glycosyltransferase family 2 protein [Rhodobacteraceae bacterium W635]|uniref:glycosyltransferase family 2 protein n=1 Tax=Nioella halotolerans TaxID=2303578 RepID=UPI000E3ED3F6|nr:glycosyltransferase family 2 protein [Rhodobacteraceae bacterium W635]